MRRAIASFRNQALVSQQDIPWIVDNDMRWVEPGMGTFRILVCGKSGVGKSTLINRVFGANVVSDLSVTCSFRD